MEALEDELEQAVKLAKECHTKVAWEGLFQRYGQLIATSAQPRYIQEIFRLLAADQQALQYPPNIWAAMLNGCIASWNLELGKAIAEFARPISSPEIAIPSAKIYLESGQPATTRDIAHRALRLTGLLEKQRLHLHLLVATSYAEEGRHSRGVKLLNQIAPEVRSSLLDLTDRADFVMQIARMQFFMGRYKDAAQFFGEAADFYSELRQWEAAAKAIFNTGVCFHNCGGELEEKAFAYIERCRKLSKEHSLAGPLSHCASFYGMIEYQHGRFAEAKDHFRGALEHLPPSDKSSRRLHVLSMLSFTYLAQGRTALAKKFGEQTLALASLDETERYKSRYICLEAALLWEEGHLSRSQEIIGKAAEPLLERGVNTLEELATISRYVLQRAHLGLSFDAPIQIAEHLKLHESTWLEYSHALALSCMNSQRGFAATEAAFAQYFEHAKKYDNRSHEALAILGLIQNRFMHDRAYVGLNDAVTQDETSTDQLVERLEVATARLADTPLRATLQVIYAARCYRLGDFEKCSKHLRAAIKTPRIGYVEYFCATSALATIAGRAVKMPTDAHEQLLAWFVSSFFAPTVHAAGPRLFVVSNHYEVNFDKHPALAELLYFLINRVNHAASSQEIQTGVWKQSIQAVGWAQKIRNTVMRLRDCFPYTIAPLVLQSENSLRLFKDAIAFTSTRTEESSSEEDILRMLGEDQLSSNDLAERLDVSLATTKRILKKLLDEKMISAAKSGRNVNYRLVSDPTAKTNVVAGGNSSR